MKPVDAEGRPVLCRRPITDDFYGGHIVHLLGTWACFYIQLSTSIRYVAASYVCIQVDAHDAQG